MTSVPVRATRPEVDSATSGGSTPPLALSARLHALLPQTQCTRCGYPDCAAYADAMAAGRADLNQCAPGGLEGIARLAAVLRRSVVALNPDHGAERPRVLAVIDENWCIGCTKCLDACPTDAIVGASKRMHTVVSAHCTGCERCVPACPVDCIETRDDSGMRTGWDAWSTAQASNALARYLDRSARLARRGRQDSPSPAQDVRTPDPSPESAPGSTFPDVAPAPRGQAGTAFDQKRALIDAAMQRARARTASKA